MGTSSGSVTGQFLFTFCGIDLYTDIQLIKISCVIWSFPQFYCVNNNIPEFRSTSRYNLLNKSIANNITAFFDLLVFYAMVLGFRAIGYCLYKYGNIQNKTQSYPLKSVVLGL